MKKAGVAKVTPSGEEISAALYKALRHVGTAGAKAAALRVSGQAPAAAARRAALTAMVEDGGATVFGRGAAARYFLAKCVPTPETVAARLLTLAMAPVEPDVPPTLWKEAELRRKLPAHEAPLLGVALDHLLAQRQVVPLRHGRNAFVAFAGPLRVWLEDDVAAAAAPVPAPLPVPAETDGDLDAEFFFAYTRLVRESGGFPDVKIADLRRVTGEIPLSERLLALWRTGRATLSLGDWSLADAATRAAAVELAGEKYLLVRLEE